MISKFLIIGGTVLLLTGCVTTNGPVDAGGRSMKLDEMGYFDPIQSRFNTFRFLELSPFYTTNAKQRDNGKGWQETVTWNAGFIHVEHVTDGWFSRFVEDDMLEGEAFRKLAERYSIDQSNFAKIDIIGSRLKGWVGKQGKCVAGAFSKRTKPLSPYDNDRGYADTAVFFGGCRNFIVTPTSFAQRFNIMSETDKKSVETTWQGLGILKHPIDFPKGESFNVSGEWRDVTPKFEGVAAPMGQDHFSFNIWVPEKELKCNGIAKNSNGEQSGRTWKFTCENGQSAEGIWMKRKNRPLIASGADNEKRPVLFKITN